MTGTDQQLQAAEGELRCVGGDEVTDPEDEVSHG
jgi:hypothetical protein